ncbi:hypothetical protein [Ruania alba]|uniref:DUF559 domain-containing protein n=1 Tax=Ruania alba TaxID=648782 RepID=A0A1H5FRY0_9MICO|nr:hypothetical protein [Ruania alba]SEE06061.1 hypothetical protein SAMN04488554_1425 [Ruania alba]
MSRLPTPLPDALSTRTFSVKDALDAGASRGQLQRSSLDSPLWGVRSTLPCEGDSRDLWSRCASYVPALHSTYAFSHVTALRLLGIEVPWKLQEDARIHVVLPRRAERPDRPEIEAHFCGRPGLAVMDYGALCLTTPPQTWMHLAARLRLDDLVVLGDAMMRRDDPWITPAELHQIAHSFPGARGVRAARAAATLVRPGTESTMESRLRLHMVSNGLPEPVVNQEAYAEDGSFLARPDLSYPELKIAIEYDGDVHRTDPATWRRDIERRQRLEDDGWLVITATADDVIRYPMRLITRVRRAIARRRPASLG